MAREDSGRPTLLRACRARSAPGHPGPTGAASPRFSLRSDPGLWEHRAMTTSANMTWQEGVVERVQRWDSIGQRGATVWFTGLPASGKSTVAAAVEAHLVRS